MMPPRHSLFLKAARWSRVNGIADGPAARQLRAHTATAALVQKSKLMHRWGERGLSQNGRGGWLVAWWVGCLVG